MSDDYQPGAVPPADDPLGDPAVAALQQRLDQARARLDDLLNQLRTAAEADKACCVRAFFAPAALEAAAVLKAHDTMAYVELCGALRPHKVITLWSRAVEEAAKVLAQDGLREELAPFNEQYGGVLFGSRFAVVREVKTDLGSWEPEFLPPRECEYFHKPDRSIGGLPLFEFWLNWPGRNTFSGVTLEPSVSFRDGARPIQQGGAYNVWQGYGYRPVEGDCQILLDHIRDVWCDGREDAYEATMNHLAGMVQNPAEPGLPLLSLVSEKEGTGKNIVVEGVFLPLYGTHGIVLDRPEALTGRFNSHLGWCVFAYINEAIWGGDKQREGAYKTLFTDKLRALEKKFRDIVMVRNFTKGILASNNEWFAPISVRDRRHIVLDVAGHRVGDTAYFQQLWQDITKSGGREAFLHKLLARNVDFDMLRTPPSLQSAAKTAAMMRGADSVDRFLHDLLCLGEIPRDQTHAARWPDAPIEIARSTLHEFLRRMVL